MRWEIFLAYLREHLFILVVTYTGSFWCNLQSIIVTMETKHQNHNKCLKLV